MYCRFKGVDLLCSGCGFIASTHVEYLVTLGTSYMYCLLY